jgi:SAM-dependent methyltransferase
MNTGTLCCQVCAQAQLQEIERFAALPRISSDCRAHPAGGRLYVCRTCGAVQKVPDQAWLDEIAGIYADYQAYYQADGDEQIVFDRGTGKPRRRSDVLVAQLAASQLLPAAGQALDVGCGNGATLRALSTALPDWGLNGFELGDGTLHRLQSIPRFQRLYTGALDGVDKGFDLVSMVHALEHFPAPHQTLQELRPAVGSGKLFIEVCNVEENPFDILVADHLMHFSPRTLARLLQRCGLEPVLQSTEWVTKEISVVAQASVPKPGLAADAPSDYAAQTCQRITAYVDWLDGLRTAAHALAGGQRPFGVFGTSIAATWLGTQLGAKVSFYVDEDSSRIGRMHLGAPIVGPADVPHDSVVYLALSPRIAADIATRLSGMPFSFAMPPTLLA